MPVEFASLCVYCGSSSGARPEYQAAARALGIILAERQIRLVYGGGRVGLMGALADAAIDAGGEVIGVIPRALMDKELGHQGVATLHVVRDMHERKHMMATLAEGFIAMPGGWGTLEELTEMLTWLQLGFHDKPIGLFNVAGYYDRLLAFEAQMVEEKFVRAGHRDLMCVASDPSDLLAKMAAREKITPI